MDKQDPRGSTRYEITRRVPLPGAQGEMIFYARHAAAAKRVRPIQGKNVREMLALVAGLVVTLALPVRLWLAWCRLLGTRRLGRQMRRDFPRFLRGYTAVLGPSVAPGAPAVLRAMSAMRERRSLTLCAELTRLRWRPELELSGAEGLQAALARGKGAILWVNQLASAGLMGKRTLHQFGFAAHQVSVSEHGFTPSMVSARVLNPLMVRAENRYLAERVVFEREDTFKVTRRILGILARNGIVLMTNNVYSGSSFIETPLGAAGYLQTASTPLNFAIRGGAALFTLSTFEVEPLRRYATVISPEISFAAPASARTVPRFEDRAAHALLQVRDHVLRDLSRAPEQYAYWQLHADSVRDARAADGSPP